MRPQFEIYAISFFIVGLYWISCHLVFNHIINSHTIRTWLNLLFLFFITLISFTTSLLISFGRYSFIFIIYSTVLTITGALLALIWIHSKVTNHIDKTTDKNKIMNVLLEDMLIPSMFALSIPLFFINANVAHYFWLLILPSKIIMRKRFSYKWDKSSLWIKG